MRAEDLTAGQLVEALRTVYEVIAVPLAVFDEDEAARIQALVCRTLVTESYLDALLGIGDEQPFEDFPTWLAGMAMQVDEYPARYPTWDDVDSDANLRARAEKIEIQVSAGPRCWL